MKQRLKTILAFVLLSVTTALSFILSALDRPTDVFPTEDTKIRLYGERHGEKLYYDIEFDLWRTSTTRETGRFSWSFPTTPRSI